MSESITLPRETVLDSIPASSEFLGRMRSFLVARDPTLLGGWLEKVAEGLSLDFSSARNAVNELMDEGTPDELRAAFLAVLRAKGESEEEIAAFATLMRERAAPLGLDGVDLIDTCGTGADGSSSFNVSTGIIFILAACGLKVAKHGNRAITSRSGSADLLEALGARIELEPASVAASIRKCGIGFLFAPKFHTVTQRVMTARKELAAAGWKTVFNILGPLTNPARPSAQLLGVYEAGLLGRMADVLARLGTRRSLVVWGETGNGRGMDEVSLSGPTRAIRTRADGKRVEETILPEVLGLSLVPPDRLRGGSPAENAETLRTVLKTGKPDVLRSFLLINAGAALYTSGMVADIREGIERGSEVLADGTASRKVQEFVEVTHDA